MSFDGLVSVFEGLLPRDEAVSGDETPPPTEREAFLVRELLRFIYDTELTSGEDDRVLVIPVRRAWDEFKSHKMYFCQPERSFRPSTYLALYRDNRIEPKVPRITGDIDRAELTAEGVQKAYESGDLTEIQRSELKQAVEAFEVEMQSGTAKNRSWFASTRRLASSSKAMSRTTRPRRIRRHESRSCPASGT
jgi:hypothetical protein